MGLVRQLTESGKIYPGRVIRGIILADSVPEDRMNPGTDLDRMHEAGVRGVRVHGYHGGSGDDIEWAYNQLLRASSFYPVRNMGWVIFAQFSLATWSGLADQLLASDSRGDTALVIAKIVADHNACAASKDLGGHDLGAVVNLLAKSSAFYIKLGAFYRREPLDIFRIHQVVELFASAAPGRLLWGSDWPHVDVTGKGLDPTPHLRGIRAADELRTLELWLSPDEFNKILVDNPASLFG